MSAITTLVLPSVREAPSDPSGIYARQGFAYQDDVAARFYIEMLATNDLSDVACETHDDVLLIWKRGGIEIAEYLQVKSDQPDQLWTAAKLCEKERSTTHPDGAGTSILEKSLARDAHQEPSWFGIVTSRQIRSDLEVLTRERGHEHRQLSYEPFKELNDYVAKQIGSFESKKGSGASYWLVNARWLVISESDIVQLNEQRLARVLHDMGEPSDPDAVRSVYGNLRVLAKETAELPIERRSEKYVSRTQLLTKIKEWNQPYPGLGVVERLQQKMGDAGLDSTCFDVAIDQRRFYLRKKRSGAYLSVDAAEDVDQQVLDALHRLRSALDSGELVEGGVQFHDRCLKELNAIASYHANAIPGGYLSGCMYEIAARCRHRYTKVRP